MLMWSKTHRTRKSSSALIMRMCNHLVAGKFCSLYFRIRRQSARHESCPRWSPHVRQPINFSGKLYEFVQYGVREDTGLIDYDELASIAEKEKPKMITVGASAYSRIIDFDRMGEIARSVGAYLFADIAHISGLVAGGMHPSPVPHADFVTTTTHKTLLGTRRSHTLQSRHAKAIDSAMFPGGQGGPLMVAAMQFASASA